MKTSLNYGTSKFTLEFNNKVLINHKEPAASISPEKFSLNLISHLQKKIQQLKNIGIIVSDKTRLCQYPIYLPVLTNALLEYGIPKENVTFYIAYGTHTQQTDTESRESYGESYNQFRFVHHDSRDIASFRQLGITSQGTNVRIAEAVMQHDLLITFGAILHHYFAGYGGGRKLLFPGLAAYESIMENHRLFLDFKTRTLATGCQSGRLDHNPLALDLEEISSMLPPRLEIHTILNSQKEVCEIFTGTNHDDFREVCRIYDQYFRSAEVQQFDLVVASAGGYPKDINFIQAHKSIHNAASFVKNGGKLVIFAECRDGIGNPGMMDLFRWGGQETIFGQLEVEYRNNAGTALSMLEKSGRINIRMVTSLSEEECRLMGAIRCSAEDVQKMIDLEQGSVAVLENAGMLYR